MNARQGHKAADGGFDLRPRISETLCKIGIRIGRNLGSAAMRKVRPIAERAETQPADAVLRFSRASCASAHRPGNLAGVIVRDQTA